jgi:hypothetical protein
MSEINYFKKIQELENIMQEMNQKISVDRYIQISPIRDSIQQILVFTLSNCLLFIRI